MAEYKTKLELVADVKRKVADLNDALTELYNKVPTIYSEVRRSDLFFHTLGRVRPQEFVEVNIWEAL
jgi:predicted ATP-binding protein involved in virulence